MYVKCQNTLGEAALSAESGRRTQRKLQPPSPDISISLRKGKEVNAEVYKFATGRLDLLHIYFALRHSPQVLS